MERFKEASTAPKVVFVAAILCIVGMLAVKLLSSGADQGRQEKL